MIKTQITVPDELYHQAKAIAKAKEWSLAEVFRRGLEYMAEVHKPNTDKEWQLPEIELGDYAPRTLEELNAAVAEDTEEYLLHKLGQ